MVVGRFNVSLPAGVKMAQNAEGLGQQGTSARGGGGGGTMWVRPLPASALLRTLTTLKITVYTMHELPLGLRAAGNHCGQTFAYQRGGGGIWGLPEDQVTHPPTHHWGGGGLSSLIPYPLHVDILETKMNVRL